MIICTSILCSVFKMFLPSDRNGMGFAMKAFILCVLLSPLFKWSGVLIKNNFVVITEESNHTLDNEDADMIYKRWLAKSCANNLAEEIEEGIAREFGIIANVFVPWYEEGKDILFDILTIKADCSDDKLEKINTWVKIHYSLESRVILEKTDAG